MTHWQSMLVKPEATIAEATRIIDSGGGQIAIVVDAERRLTGVITDADIRKAVIGGIDFKSPCSVVMTPTPVAMSSTSSDHERFETMRRRHVHQLPIVDANNRLVDVVLLMDLVASHVIPNPAVIMAGGLGSRLGNLTANAPKPLLDVGGRPLLETILCQLIDQGFREFYLSVNYRAEMIVDYFGCGSRWGVKIDYLEEKTRLGTAGALHLLPDSIDRDILVMNGDILTTVNARHIFATHSLSNSSITIAVKDYIHDVPYGVVDVDGEGGITGFREKPQHRHFVSAGIYVISPRALKLIPENKYFDMPSLFEKARRNQLHLQAFPLREYWRDIGLPQDYHDANSEFDHHFSGEDNAIAVQNLDLR